MFDWKWGKRLVWPYPSNYIITRRGCKLSLSPWQTTLFYEAGIHLPIDYHNTTEVVATYQCSARYGVGKTRSEVTVNSGRICICGGYDVIGCCGNLRLSGSNPLKTGSIGKAWPSMAGPEHYYGCIGGHWSIGEVMIVVVPVSVQVPRETTVQTIFWLAEGWQRTKILLGLLLTSIGFGSGCYKNILRVKPVGGNLRGNSAGRTEGAGGAEQSLAGKRWMLQAWVTGTLTG